MSLKWLDTAYQFESEPSGGGEDPPPAEPVVEPVAEPAPEPAAEPPPAEPAEPPPELPDDGGEPPEPKAEPTPTPAAAVGVPKAFDGLFNPPAPAAQPRPATRTGENSTRYASRQTSWPRRSRCARS